MNMKAALNMNCKKGENKIKHLHVKRAAQLF